MGVDQHHPLHLPRSWYFLVVLSYSTGGLAKQGRASDKSPRTDRARCFRTSTSKRAVRYPYCIWSAARFAGVVACRRCRTVPPITQCM